MKISAAVLFIMISVLSGIIFPQQLTDDDKKEILTLLKDQELKWNEGDIEGFMQGYWHSDSLRFISSKRINYGWQKTLDGYRKAYPDKKTMGKLTFDFDSVELLGERNAMVVGAWTLKRENDSPGGHFVLILRKIEGKWLIILDHTS